MDTISQSKLGMALRCGEAARRRYIDGEILPPNIARARGTGVHQASKVNLSQKIQSRMDLPLDDLKDAARDGYIKSFSQGIYLTPDEVPSKNSLINEGLNDTIRCTEKYHEAVAPTYQPLTVEEPFTIDVGLPVALTCIMDIGEQGRVGDLKTASVSWPGDRIHQEIQPPFYSFMHERKHGFTPVFQYDILVPLKEQTKHQIQVKICSEKDYRALFAKIGIVIEMFKRGFFPPSNPSAWWCSPKWCGYHSTCPYVGNKLPKKWA